LQRIWDEAKPVEAGDDVAEYLAKRGLALEAFPRVLRTHPALGYFERESNRSRRLGTFAAMLAKVQAVDRRPVTLHRTYVAEGAKAPVPGVKKLFSAGVRGAAIRLFEPENELALAEGIETALAVHLRLGLPVWAAGNAGALEAVEIPASVISVSIFADCDENYCGKTSSTCILPGSGWQRDVLGREGVRVGTLPSLPARTSVDPQFILLQSLRVVRHLPERVDDAMRCTGLRAGVGQASREETAGHAAVLRPRASAMAIWATAAG
jgi:putative DNA primase/helicase